MVLILLLDVPQYRHGDSTAIVRWPWIVRGLAICGMIVLIVLSLLIVILRRTGETPFIYFQF